MPDGETMWGGGDTIVSGWEAEPPSCIAGLVIGLVAEPSWSNAGKGLASACDGRVRPKEYVSHAEI